MERFNFRIPKAAIAESGKKISPMLRHTVGKPNRRILLEKTVDGIEYSYHATKGWRQKREYDIADNPAGDLLISFLPK